MNSKYINKRPLEIAFTLALAFFSLFLLSGCSGMLDSLKEESEEVAREEKREEEYNRGAFAKTKERYRGLSANSVDEYGPQVRRARERAKDAGDDFEGLGREMEKNVDAASDLPRRRYSRADFIDNSNGDSSLWNSQGQGNFYFARNSRFESGDLVVVTVDRALRREIQYALWKSLPAEQRRIRRKPSSVDDAKKDAKTVAGAAAAAGVGNKEADEKLAAEEAAKSSLGAGDKDIDLIRMEIMENLGNGLVRLQGQKRVIYRGRPKFVEVSGLVRGKDIDDQARVNSKTFLDMRSRAVE